MCTWADIRTTSLNAYCLINCMSHTCATNPSLTLGVMFFDVVVFVVLEYIILHTNTYIIHIIYIRQTAQVTRCGLPDQKFEDYREPYCIAFIKPTALLCIIGDWIGEAIATQTV